MIHRATTCTLLATALCVLPLGSLASQTATAPVAEREVATTLALIDSALARRDVESLESFVAPGFTWVHASDGRVDTREVWLANAAQGNALTALPTARSVHGLEFRLHGTPEPHTAVRLARVRLLDTVNVREVWLRQTQVLVRDDAGVWRLVHGQGTLVYDGPPQDTVLLARYAGTYTIGSGRVLQLSWEDGALFATLPSGAKSQIFLASPTEEAVRVPGAGQLRFALAADGQPVVAALVRDGREIWRATRATP